MIYKNEESVPLLKKSFAIFLDLLGFSDEIMGKSNSGEGNDHLLSIYNAFNNASSILDGYSIWEKRIFSDNILLGSPIEYPHIHPESIFGSLISGIMHFQLQLTLKGYFVRGGWCIGELFVDDNMIYGEALIHAVNLEKEANYPRIILSKEVESLCKTHLKFYNPKFESPQNFHLLKDEEGNYFINYLYGLYPEEFEEDMESCMSNLLLHKNNVMNNLKRFEGKDKIYDKYLWAAHYHNFFCKEFLTDYASLIIEIQPKFSFHRIIDSNE
jgi:hypothetical protein